MYKTKEVTSTGILYAFLNFKNVGFKGTSTNNLPLICTAKKRPVLLYSYIEHMDTRWGEEGATARSVILEKWGIKIFFAERPEKWQKSAQMTPSARNLHLASYFRPCPMPMYAPDELKIILE